MAPTSDIPKPHDDPYSLVGDSWPQESEGSYRAAEVAADDAATAATTQGESSDSAAKQTDSGMQGKTADSVSGGYEHLATQLHAQSQHFTAISGWMLDAGGKVQKAKSRIANLVRSGTSEIRNSFDSELRGTPASPSSAELTTKYRADIAAVKSTLDRDLDAIGHSLTGDPGSSTTPSYTSVPTSPTTERPNPTAQVVSYNSGQSPEVTPTKLPEMPRATASSTTDSASSASTPATPVAPHPAAPHPTLSNLVSGGQSTGTPSTGTSTPHTSSPSTPSTQAHQPSEQRQTSKHAGAPHIPSLQLPDLPNVPLDTIGTAVSAAVGHQLPTAPSTTSTPSVPASTDITPGVPGTSPTAPMTSMTPGLAPIGGGGGLATPAVTQPVTPVTPVTPAAPPAASQQTSPPRSPAADLSWIQRTYGLAPGVELPKSEPLSVPALFITNLPESEAHLHRALATLRQQFESRGWSPPLAVATIRRGFETRTVYVTADGVSIHPSGVLLPSGVIPLDEIPNAPASSDLSGSIMVTDKIKSLIPRGWEVQSMLSTLPADENHQSPEQYQELVVAGKLLPCKGSRGRDGVAADEAMSVFARAALGSAGCGELDVESARLRAARWIGTQPVGYGEVLSRWYLSDAADAMSAGRWGDAVYCSEKYLPVVDTKRQVA
ncbi:hypothetical protein [Mycobacteroides abscessus]|uniref:hypothetical protein n=1 Tax=Mycobacteroides abscessus TaxID=36809 RepID=UPI000928CFFB|nr:hypothetical protein [Mycobacteroides abscessus]SIE99581.1 Uncharacterised protein [Mycobacteroides abscessus subsp. abscessus]